MREIKFRARSIEKQDWVYFGIDNVPSWVDPAEAEQYTGLKDKNGKEIYEGDIIACKFHPQFVERVNWEQVDIIGKVFWDLCGFSLNARNAEDDRRYPDLVDLNRNESEVIGNIYEHPHLLKEAESNVHQA